MLKIKIHMIYLMTLLCFHFTTSCNFSSSEAPPQVENKFEKNIEWEHINSTPNEAKEDLEVETQEISVEEIVSEKRANIPVSTDEKTAPKAKDEVINKNELESRLEESRQEELEEVKEKVVEEETNESEQSNVISKENVIEEEALVEVLAQPNHSLFNDLVKKFIDNSGHVNYSGFKKSESELDEYLSELDQNIPASSWSRDEKLAYWINAYNAFTIKLILKNFPVAKITDLDGGDPWKVKWISLGGKKYSLNNIEHDIIRPTFKEPRIHFVVNCAAKSCPPIQNEAFTATNLERLLQKSTQSFIANKNFNVISPNSAQLSKIFEWYRGDFGDLISFLNKYGDINLEPKASIEFIDYDWALNGK